MMQPHQGFILGSCIIAGAIGFHAFVTGMDHFGVASVAPGVVARIDQRDGKMEFCGNALAVSQLLYKTKLEWMQSAQISAEVQTKLQEAMTRALLSSHCMLVGPVQGAPLSHRP